jgi:tRNA dimethylallyltransferase
VAAVVEGVGPGGHAETQITFGNDEKKDHAGGWPLMVVAGPTASGKTALAIALAEALERQGRAGEIVSCDSVAVYRLMEIGSAKPTAAERERVPHHGLDLYWPDEVCTAGDYARAGRAAIAAIRARGHVPIVAGGTGLYLRALLDGLAPAPQRNEALRQRLRATAARHGVRVAQHGTGAAQGDSWLHRILGRLDARAAGLIHANDTPKLIRSLEVTLAARQPQTMQWEAGREALVGYRVLQIGLAPEREALYARINARAAAMFSRGLIAETAMLRDRYGEDCRSLTALGYAQAMAVLRGEMAEAEAVRGVQQGHRNYAKRQGTWFRRDERIEWLGGFGDEAEVQAVALGRVREFVAG